VIWGARNSLVDTDHGNAFASGIRNATLSIIEDAGHAVTVEQPDELAKTIGSFIDQQEKQ
jgi:pimeloyl-ACP methyl ester carboxylesterase